MAAKKNDGKFKPGNQLWKRVDPSKLGRPPDYKTPVDLWKDAVGYFQHCDDNPIQTLETIVTKEGKAIAKDTAKKAEYTIAYTWAGLYVYCNVANLDHYKTKTDFSGVLEQINNVMRQQKFEGAAAGIFNAAIIARDLGLKEKSEMELNGKILTDKMTPKERKARIAELALKAAKINKK